MCSTHFTLSCRILLFSLPTTNSFFKFMYSEITGRFAWRVLFRLPSLATEGPQYLTHFNSGLLICRTFLPHAGSSCTLLSLYLVYCTQKMHWRAYNLADIVPPFFDHFTVFFRTEVLVCPVYVLYEFIVLDNSIKLLYFHVSFPVFPPFVYKCCIMDRTYHLHKFCPSTLAPLRHHSSRTLTSLFPSTCLPLLGQMECPMPLLALLVPHTLTFLSSNV